MPGCLSFDREGPDAPLFPLSLPLNLFPFHLSLSIPRFSINNSSIHSPPAFIYHLKVASAGTFLTKQLRDKLPTTSQPTNTSQRDTTTVVGRCIPAHQQNPFPRYPANFEFMSIENLKTYGTWHSIVPHRAQARPRPPSPLCIGHPTARPQLSDVMLHVMSAMANVDPPFLPPHRDSNLSPLYSYTKAQLY